MKKLTMNQWIMIGVGVVVLYFVYRYVKSHAFYLDFEKEPTASASGWGKQQCQCQGRYMGTCTNWLPNMDCCERKCRSWIIEQLES